MGTFLTNDKMSPELRARIEASVSGRHRGDGLAPALRAGLRLVTLLLVVGTVGIVAVKWRRQTQQIDQAQAALLADLHRGAAGWRDQVRPRVEALRKALRAAASEPYGDTLQAAQGDLDHWLARPALYVRGPVEAFRGDDGYTSAVTDSVKDAFLYCLAKPPPSRNETDLVLAVNRAYKRGAAIEEATPTVHRLHDLERALPLLDPAFADQIRDAALPRLAELRQELEQAQLSRAKAASEAELLIYFLDEPKVPGTPSELDGASNHYVRIGIVDLSTGRHLWRRRERIDPSWISDTNRGHLAVGLDACRLAHDLRAEG
ncbi:MAG: hypothetical protein KC731_35935 [Myxococcales bacterium]|nr:hypothetical protein [Myxococcales bacterium]